jgi:hypothetical protein
LKLTFTVLVCFLPVLGVKTDEDRGTFQRDRHQRRVHDRVADERSWRTIRRVQFELRRRARLLQRL